MNPRSTDYNVDALTTAPSRRFHIFNRSWSLHSFPSIWKISSIIPIHKMGKPLDSPASSRPISLTFCASKLFERIILSRLLFFFLESNSILSPRQAGFCPGQSTLDEALFHFQSTSDRLNKPRPGSRTILSTSPKLSNLSGTLPFSTNSLRLASILALLVGLSLSFLISDCIVFQTYKSRSFRVRRGVLQGSILDPVLFSLFIRDLRASLPSSVSCSLYADNLAIGSSSALVPTAVVTTQGPPIRMDRWSEYRYLPLNSSKCETFSSQLIHTMLTSSPTSTSSTPTYVSTPLKLFLGSPSTALFPFLNMYLR